MLLHGIGSNAQSFVPLMQALADAVRRSPGMRPATATSQQLAAEWPDASDYAAALNRLLAHLDISRCILLGHSLGALIAARFARGGAQARDGAVSGLARARP